MITQTFSVDGMTCGHCAAAVRDEIAAVPGVTTVHVDLVAGGRSTVTVESARGVTDDAVRGALDDAGDYVLAPEE